MKPSIIKRIEALEEYRPPVFDGFQDKKRFKLIDGIYHRIPQPDDPEDWENEELFRFVSPGDVDDC